MNQMASPNNPSTRTSLQMTARRTAKTLRPTSYHYSILLVSLAALTLFECILSRFDPLDVPSISYTKDDPTQQYRHLNIIDDTREFLEPVKSVVKTDIQVDVQAQRHHCIQNIRQRHENVLATSIRKFENSQNNNWHLLLDPAYQDNLGDTLLTKAEQQFFLNQGIEVRECLYYKTRFGSIWREKCPDAIGKTPKDGPKLAFWHAGGNWGDIWPATNKRRLPSMKYLLQKNFSIIGMPQSLYYKSQKTEAKQANILKESIAEGLGFSNSTALDDMNPDDTRVTLSWREQSSYERALELFPFVRNVVVPDIAFQLGPFEPIRRREDLAVDFLIVLRGDKESVISSEHDTIQAILSDNSTFPDPLTYRVVDWNDRLSLFNNSDVFNVTTGIEMLSLGKVVICDRLHAAILSYLSGLPFVYLDQTSGKVTKTLSVALEQKDGCSDGRRAAWEKADSIQEALVKAMRLKAIHSPN